MPIIRQAAVVACVLAGALASAACATGTLLSIAGTGVAGRLTVQRPGQTAPTAVPLAQCTSGDRYWFYGVDLSDAEGATRLRIVLDPLGATRLRYTEGERDFVFDRSTCGELTAGLRPTVWLVNDVRAVEGEIRFECTAPDGTRVEGELRFRHCH